MSNVSCLLVNEKITLLPPRPHLILLLSFFLLLPPYPHLHLRPLRVPLRTSLRSHSLASRWCVLWHHVQHQITLLPPRPGGINWSLWLVSFSLLSSIISTGICTPSLSTGISSPSLCTKADML